jgi:hypothetical protein
VVVGTLRYERGLSSLTLAALLGACSSDGAPASNASGAGGGSLQGGVAASALPYEPCAPANAVGQFVIELAPEYTRVGGRVSDAVLPSRVPNELASAGDCRLVEAVVTSCEPGCPVATEVCGREGSCVPLPRARDLGTVRVFGLLVPLEMRPNVVTKSYANPADPVLPNPGFLPGADLRITTGAGDYAPFELRGWGITALTLAGTDLQVRPGQALGLSWQAPEVAGPARLHVELNINQHGATSAWVECDFLDSGAAEIPAQLVDGLIGVGLSGYPTLTAARRTATRAEIEPGCVDLLVTSEVISDISVEGIVSCDVSADCPVGQSCLPVERFCE